MSTPQKPLTVTLVQTDAGKNPADNLRRIDELLAPGKLGDLIALPEVFAIRGTDEDYRRHAQPLDGPIVRHLSDLARRTGTWVLAGSIIECAPNGPFNTTVLLDRSGAIAATYRKIHLFEAELEDGTIIRERDTYQAGSSPVMVDIEGWQCGLAICYDLRFPELFRRYSAHGAHVLFVPSNFTQRTGRDHWEVLVRARAIENQCFVAAPNQCGANPATRVASHGHSMLVGPWGEVLSAAGDKESIITATLDPRELAQTRRRVPALMHRRL
jgi:deaminated glutathione amidase